MKLYLTFLSLFIFGLFVPTSGQTAKLEGYVTSDKGARVAGVRIVVTPGGQIGTTDSQGHFAIRLPDHVQPGQAAQLRIDRSGWVIFNPMLGRCETKSVERNYEPLAVVIVPKNSPLALSPARLSAVIAKWAAERVKLRAEAGNLRRKLDEYEFLREYATEYGFTLEQFRAAAEEWAQTKESDDKEERSLKEYYRQNYERAAQLAEESAETADEELEQAQRRTAAASEKVIRRYKLAGNAFYADYKFSEALAAYGEIEKRFETRRISKEDFREQWAEVQLLIGNTKGELGARVEGTAGPRLLREAIVAYRQAESFYTRVQLPQDWAATQNNLGNVLLTLGEQAESSDSLKYLSESAAAYRAALEVYTRAQLPQQWAMSQNNLGNVLLTLGERAEGNDSLKYLSESAAAYRAALEVRTRAQLPQQWAETQNNLGVVLHSLGERAEGSDSLKYLSESAAAYRAALEVRTRAQSPQDWAMSQNNLGVALQSLGEQAEGNDGLKYLSESAAAYHAALEVYTRAQLPQQWAMSQNNLGMVLRALGERAESSDSLKYLSESAAAYRAALEVYTRALPQQWATAQNNLGNVLLTLGERAEGNDSLKYLSESAAAYRAALEVRTRAQLPQQWAAVQNNLGNVLLTLGKQAEGSDSLKYLSESAAAYRAALEVYTRAQLPQQWAAVQNNLGVVLRALGERAEGSDSLKYLSESAAAYRAALEVYTRAQSPQDWAMSQNNLAFTYLLLRDWVGANEAYTNVLQVYPDNAVAYSRSTSLYHEVLFKFNRAFVLHQQWITRHPYDVSAQADFAETHFTTARFAECATRITPLLAHPELPESAKIALRAIEIASLLALKQSPQASAKLDLLIAEVARQPPTFKLTWSFDGTRHFIKQNEQLSASRSWLEQLLDALASKDRDTMLSALREARTTFKE